MRCLCGSYLYGHRSYLYFEMQLISSHVDFNPCSSLFGTWLVVSPCVDGDVSCLWIPHDRLQLEQCEFEEGLFREDVVLSA